MVLGAAALSAGGVDAARGGAHGGGTTPPPTTGTCSVTPNPVPANSTYTISGSGFAGQYIVVYVGGTSLIPTVRADGTFAIAAYADVPGNYTVWVQAKAGSKWATVATCYFQVV